VRLSDGWKSTKIRTGTPRLSDWKSAENRAYPSDFRKSAERTGRTRRTGSWPRTGCRYPSESDCRKPIENRAYPAGLNTAYPSDYRKATENTAYPSDCRKPAENRTGTPYLSAAGNRAYPLDCRKLAENGSYPSDCRKPTEKRARTPYQSDDWKLDEKTGEDAVPVGLD